MLKLTRWETFHREHDGRKVLFDSKLKLDSFLYHRLEWRYARQIFEQSRLRLSPVATWVDPFEGWWCRELFGRSGSPLHGLSPFALCWTTSKLDEPAWRMTGYGRSEPIVRVRCTVRSLLEAAQADVRTEAGSWFLGCVRYRRTDWLQSRADELDQLDVTAPRLKDVGRTAASLLTRKRRAFQFEKEVRLIFLPSKGAATADEKFLPIDTKIISDVMTSPHANVNERKLVVRELKPYHRKPRRSLVLSEPHWMRTRR